MIMPNANRKLSQSPLKLAASVVRLAPFLTRIRAAAARESHNLEVTGSIPVSASISRALAGGVVWSAVFPSFSFARLRPGFFCGGA